MAKKELKTIAYTFIVRYGEIVIGKIEVSDDHMYRWTTADGMPDKAPGLLEHHLIFGVEEQEWQTSFPLFGSRVEGMIKRGMTVSGSASDDFELELVDTTT